MATESLFTILNPLFLIPYSLFTINYSLLGLFTFVENPLQIDPFMQNKPNLPDAQNCISV